MSDKTITITEPTASTQGVALHVHVIDGGALRVELAYARPGIEAVVWEGTAVPSTIRTAIILLLGGVILAGKSRMGF